MLEPTPIRRRKRLWALGLGFGTLALSLFLASRGQDEEAPAAVGAAAFMHVLLSSGLLALAYLLGGVGLGAAVMRVVAPGSRRQAWLALAVGPGLALYLSHGLGVLGLLSGPRGQWVAGGTLILGLILFLWMLLAAVKSKPNLPRPPTCSVLWILPAAVTLVAACNPPGWLWGSEAYGYDVLSYHLQLPQEWAKGARLWPLTHNVYSFLPSYVESAYLHFAAVMGGGTAASKPGMPVGLLAYDGVGAMACQLLQAGYGLIAALLVGRAVQAVLVRAGLGGRAPGEIGALAGAVMLGTPWVVVVSSMAYNEAAVNALFAGAVLAVLDEGLAAGRKGLIAGVLVGLATGCKPTAAFLVAPTVGVLLLSELPARRWVWAALAGTLGGVLAVAPFLIRNAIATHGNPVFPAGTGWFGPAHWTAEQIMRFASAHQEGSTVADRIGLLFAISGTGLGGQARGIFHEQWHALFPAGLVSLAIALSWKPLRRVGKGLGLGLLATAAWWLLLTHCQSRFLLPAAVPLAMAIGLGVGRLVQWWTEGLEPNFQRLAMIVVGALPLVLGASSTRLFLSQRPAPGGMRGYPNLLLTEGTARRTGEHVVADFSKMAQTDRDEVVKVLDYEPLINLMIPESKVYLIGAATPLYLTGNVMYHTTWDKSALGKAIRTAREQPQLWSESLRALGVEYVLIDYAELSRLGSEGWQEAELNPEAVFAWASKYCEPVRLWFAPQGPEDGRAAAPVRGLYRLSRPAGPGGRTL